MATWLEKLRKIKENDTRIKRLQETMTHGADTPMPTASDMNELRRVIALRNVPHDVAYGEKGLEGGVPTDPYLGLSPLDLIPTGAGAKLATLGGGIAGMFIGKGAKTWNAVMKDTAEKLEKQGVAPEEIWKQTGTFRGADKQWRQEIPDNLAMIKKPWPTKGQSFGETLKSSYETYGGPSREVGDVLQHEQLSSAYDDVLRNKLFSEKGRGASYANTGGIAIGEDVPMYDVKSKFGHELQHAIQHGEGWAMGGSPDFAKQMMTQDQSARVRKKIEPEMEKLADLYNKKIIGDDEFQSAAQTLFDKEKKIDDKILFEIGNDTPYNAYRRLSGEAEARLTQARMNMTPEQRAASYPPSMFDVPMENQIVRLGDLAGDSRATR